MPADILIGTQWGDEGKGKLIDVLTRDVDMVVRFQGGTRCSTYFWSPISTVCPALLPP